MGLQSFIAWCFTGSQGRNLAYNLGSDIGNSWSSGQPQDPGLPHPGLRIERGPSHHYAIIGNFPAEVKTDERDCGRLGSSGMSKVTTVLSSWVCPIPFIVSLKKYQISDCRLTGVWRSINPF